MKNLFYILFILFFLNNYIFSQDQTSDSIKKQDDNKVKTEENTDNYDNNNNVNTPKNGWDLYQEGRYYDSIILLKDEMRRFPQRINVYVILGWDYRQLRRYKEMEEISLEGLKVNSTDIRLVRNLGESYYFQNSFLNAVKEFEKYISYRYNRNDSYVSLIYYYLGVCFYNLKSFRKADIALSTARYYQPNDNNTNLYLGKTMVELKQFEKAKKYFDTVLKNSPDNTEAIEGLKRIKDFQ